MIDTMLSFVAVICFAGGLFVGAVTMYIWGNGDDGEED